MSNFGPKTIVIQTLNNTSHTCSHSLFCGVPFTLPPPSLAGPSETFNTASSHFKPRTLAGKSCSLQGKTLEQVGQECSDTAGTEQCAGERAHGDRSQASMTYYQIGKTASRKATASLFDWLWILMAVINTLPGKSKMDEVKCLRRRE